MVLDKTSKFNLRLVIDNLITKLNIKINTYHDSVFDILVAFSKFWKNTPKQIPTHMHSAWTHRENNIIFFYIIGVLDIRSVSVSLSEMGRVTPLERQNQLFV